MTATYDDIQTPLRRALKMSVLAAIILSVLSALVWGVLAGVAGLWGVLLGAAIGCFFAATTALSILVSARSNPGATGAIVLGGWLVKIALVIVALAVLKNYDFYDRPAFAVTIMVVTITMIAAEVWVVTRAKVTYVQPEQSEEAE